MRRRTLAAVLVATVAAALLPGSPAAAQAPVCRVDYQVVSRWPGGFLANVAVTNLGAAAWPAWRLDFDLAAGERVQHGWQASISQTGATVSAAAPPGSPAVPPAGAARFGFVASATTDHRAPADFLVNGGPCVPPPAPVPDPPVDNPYAGADGYRNSDWAAQVAASADRHHDLAPAMAAVAGQPTAVWLDSVEAIAGGPNRRGLRAHLDAALAQRAPDGRPVVITLVLYDLPNRACLRAPDGDFAATGDGIARYRAEFVDPIAAILAEPRYRDLRVAVVVEPEAMSGQVAQGAAQTVQCLQFQQTGAYLNTIPYVLTRLHPLPHVYAYLDAARSSVLGWPTRLGPAADLFRQVADRTPAGVASIDGFAVNVADYVPVDEPFLDVDAIVFGTPIRVTRFVDFNDHLEERTYVDALHAALVARGFPAGVGALVDTSRNGWGGPQRAVRPSDATAADRFVDESKVDRRTWRFTWCNQVGAGLGERPRAFPLPRVDAYVWVKPPGESDGQHTAPIGVIERQCDPTQEMPPIGGNSRRTNALPGGTPRGTWFDAAFAQLVANAYPGLP